MRKYLLATHGKLASGIKDSIEIITGMGDYFEIIEAYVDGSDYTKQISNFVNATEASKQTVIFTDLYGGSVNQRIVLEVQNSQKENIFVITGMNLAIVISILLCKEELTVEKVQEIILESQVQLIEVNKLADEDEEEEFF
ncbi:PTS sugar transporter subunit IIA [Carnobacterium maltaromaticum]|uniref:PTS sugar transporter subunit IIA n=1 Tax=Carnobacterium maltaromaticum TaxID=2751 RepID=UPI00191B9699|nr:PTS fructose transporter subunit IIA [Carnobacterium maltaromaticum]CAD5901832.1 PTS mannnose transporter subunit IIA [Carnobacterium maltaromaticum]